ncbi:PTS sugar transporter subunit IIC, partial [Salmonella enterica subsp. enterica serovar Anatum]|nr:PTS sugar transporter subunit IIC [Salmonella enterica subsp. enterica serovar Anatum]
DSQRGQIAIGWLIVEDLVMVLTLVLLPAVAGMVEKGDVGIASYFLSGFLPVFFAILLGSAAVTWFLDAIPAFITNGLVVASKIL